MFVYLLTRTNAKRNCKILKSPYVKHTSLSQGNLIVKEQKEKEKEEY
jgi:hypothetical protein